MKYNLLYYVILTVCLFINSTVSNAVTTFVKDTTAVSESKKVVSQDTTIKQDSFSDIEDELDSMKADKKKSDTTKIRIGKMKIAVIEDGKNIIIDKDDWDNDNDKDFDEDWTDKGEDYSFHHEHNKKHSDHFKPHWAGFAMGLNNYCTSDFSTSLPSEYRYMDLNTNKSYQVDLNIADLGLNIIKHRVGLATGVGFRWNNYKFSNTNLVLEKGPDELKHYYDSSKNYSKSKLMVAYLTVPLLIEFQIPTHGEEFYLAAGVEGALKLGAHTKNKNDSGNKTKNHSDFYVTPYTWDLTARLGYGNFGLYADYHMEPLFKKGEGPELYPFSVGVSLNF